MLKDLLEVLCRSMCEQQGLTYIAWQRSVPIPGQQASYEALASNGSSAVHLRLDDANTALMREMEHWVVTGRGPCPSGAAELLGQQQLLLEPAGAASSRRSR